MIIVKGFFYLSCNCDVIYESLLQKSEELGLGKVYFNVQNQDT